MTGGHAIFTVHSMHRMSGAPIMNRLGFIPMGLWEALCSIYSVLLKPCSETARDFLLGVSPMLISVAVEPFINIY